MYRILIVDDEPMIRKGLEKLVEQSELPIAQIRVAENGVDALEQIRNDRPDFLFTDIRMPKMDGLELCSKLTELEFTANMQIVVISGYSDFEYAQKCLSYGVKEYLLKPINKKVIHDVLRKLIANTSKQTKTSVSVFKLDGWAEQTEDAIWTLQLGKINELLHTFRQQCSAHQLTISQLCDLLDECYALLIKKLNTRDVFAFISGLRFHGVETEEEAWHTFEAAIMDIFNELKQKRKGKAKDPVEEAKLYIEEHLAREVSLEEVADYIGLNASYFSQLFKQTTQETFVQYRIRRRMEKAKKLLEIPHYRITDISNEVGYADHPHFTKTFKKYTGCLPSEFRHKLGIE
ncbi:response regulator [Paenibacillus thalictri]|uniref:Response regulator n=2 Tax=Paenibacillus thalictri TaxID=2527873 RepID=A0A4Q9DRD1_9BACL|nr:response regulator [Paenibacillus thalictri]TBL78362.1 response regulator [Paenibacillus thalictri]